MLGFVVILCLVVGIALAMGAVIVSAFYVFFQFLHGSNSLGSGIEEREELIVTNSKNESSVLGTHIVVEGKARISSKALNAYLKKSPSDEKVNREPLSVNPSKIKSKPLNKSTENKLFDGSEETLFDINQSVTSVTEILRCNDGALRRNEENLDRTKEASKDTDRALDRITKTVNDATETIGRIEALLQPGVHTSNTSSNNTKSPITTELFPAYHGAIISTELKGFRERCEKRSKQQNSRDNTLAKPRNN